MHDKEDVYALVRSVKWHQLLTSEADTLKCDCIVGLQVPSGLTHSHFTALTVKNAIVDHFRDRGEQRPSVCVQNATVVLSVYLHQHRATLFRVWSGVSSLHKRSYRGSSSSFLSGQGEEDEAEGPMHKAMLRETTAAALLMLAFHKTSNDNKNDVDRSVGTLTRLSGSRQQPYEVPAALCDPLCGSGTLLIEAALLACDVAPGLLRYNHRSPRSWSTGVQDKTRSAALGANRDARRDEGDGHSDDDDVDGGRSWLSSAPKALFWRDLSRSSEESAQAIWKELWSEALARDKRRQMHPPNHGQVCFWANDKHEGALRLARSAAERAEVAHLMRFSAMDVKDLSAHMQRTSYKADAVISNPPWDLRLSQAESSWRHLDQFLQHERRRRPRLSSNSNADEDAERPAASVDRSKDARDAGASSGLRRVYLLTGDSALAFAHIRHAEVRGEVRFSSSNTPLSFLRYDL